MATKANTSNDKYLSNLIVKRAIGANRFIGKKIFVPYMAKDNENKYWKYDKSNFIIEDSRADAASPAKLVDFDFTYGDFSMDRHKLSVKMDDDTFGAMDDALKLGWQEKQVKFLMDKMELEAESLMLTALTTPGNYPSAHRLTGSGLAYINGSNVDIFTDIFDPMIELLNSKGIQVNTFACDSTVWKSIKNNGDFLARLNNSSNRNVSVSAFKELLSDPENGTEISQVLVSNSVYRSSDQSSATDTFSYVAPAFCWFGYVDPSAPTLMSETFGKLMMSADTRRAVQTYRPDEIEADITKVIWKYKPEFISNECGVILTSPLQ